MRKEIIFLISLFLGLSAEAQKTKYKNFCGSYWFTSDKGSEFYKADTIKLLKKHRPEGKQDTQNYVEDLGEYYEGSNFISIHLKKRKKMDFSTTLIDNWVVQRKKGKYTWSFDKKNKKFKFFYEKNLLGEFEIVEVFNVYVRSKFANGNKIQSQEMVLKRSR